MISLLGRKFKLASPSLLMGHSVGHLLVKITGVFIASGLIMIDLTEGNFSAVFGQTSSHTNGSALTKQTLKPLNRNGNESSSNNIATGNTFASNNFRGAVTQLKRSNRRWIEVRIRSQKLYAWQGNKLVFRSNISAGKSDSPTPTGLFTIQTKHNTAPMRGEGYNIPDVPFVMYYDGNYAIHGAYWHRKFGVPISRGCVNLDPDQAARLFRWADVGTPIVIRE